MCRLLYINSKEQFSIAGYLKKFAKISKASKEYQGHGWGCSFLSENKWQHYKNILPIWEDDFTKFGRTTRLIAHARSAFRNEGVVVENNMPFYDENYIFIFNGELKGVKIKEGGRIGAEKIFNYIKRFDKGNIYCALNKGTEIIIKKSSYVRAMNIILSEKLSTYVFSYFNEQPEYFTMYKKSSDQKIIVCSDPLDTGKDWTPIKSNSLAEYRCL
jgi:glutamine amidotransferase